ncbi:MAG: hypothetical protein K9G39_10610 [Chlorobium sp.]|uniref:hypothetical protein n=1 Tax=Chlorobium sp. TaxID=1095 RepID=UPI0025C35667|nr:hypothetical protein [Chlorobium sp.]MCF8384019.1 hypothetical protein [Chlorobium sp.]
MTCVSRETPPPRKHSNLCRAIDFISNNLYNCRCFLLPDSLDATAGSFLAYDIDKVNQWQSGGCPLERLVWLKEMAGMITIENDPKFIGKSLDALAFHYGVKLVLNRPGKPAEKTCFKNLNAGSGSDT